ncbi:MAG: hypothetical protein Athens101428_232 [Candidatus Berkelbacteria bacterium Athens1014_28]|uniref:Zn-dependent hydrolase of the beta-lactamase fold-like protein n=1 Tax=Candidatus Berkelbacteria bacterium Athens1014_28 TaxID=2017145 RepID=A0A554LP00_9BACT|nr:MAG: hypothetical protein Athens101428_232 [Candidatus Berkelbacteria bacterium Athens1014_28]
MGGGDFKIKTLTSVVQLSDGVVDINGFTIKNPGEYERKNVFVESPIKKPVFRIQIEDVSILYIGKTKSFTGSEIETLDGVDVFLLPCGNDDSMPLKEALNLSSTLDPSIIIPMYYSSVDQLKKEGVDGEIVKNVKISKSTLPQEGSEVIILEEVK